MSKELVSTVRSGTIDSASEAVEKFPFDAFEFTSPAATVPYVKLRDAWTFLLILSSHANNAAAVAAGLPVGALYRNGANPDVVCVVH